MKVFTTALAAALASSAAIPAFAEQGGRTQPSAGQAQGQQPQRRFDLSRAEQVALQPLITADQAAQTARTAGQPVDYAPVRALLPAAVAAARGNDAKYLVARVQLNAALNGSDDAAQQAAINALLTNPSTPADEQTRLRAGLEAITNRQAVAAFNRQDFQTAERLFRQLSEAHPEDAALRNNLAVVQSRLGNTAGTRDLVLQNIRTAEAAGRPAAESDYRNALALANQANDRDQAMDWAAKLAQNYPTAANWRAAIAQARLRSGDETQYLIDIYRLAFKANALQASPQSNEYVGLANELGELALAAEARAVLQAGIDTGALQPTMQLAAGRTVAAAIADYQARSQRDQAGLAGEVRQAQAAANGRYARNIGDAYYGLGRYVEAVQMYRLAQTKGGEDPNLINTRIGVSLALAGQRAEAETALRAVTGPRADLAKLWLAWLARRTG